MGVKDADSHKLSFHPERVAEWVKNGSCVPLHAEIGLTNRCNHKCMFCTLDWITHGNKTIKKDTLMRALVEMADIGIKSVYYAGEGEPTLHENFVEIIKETKLLGMSAALSTNGSRYTKDVAEETLPLLSWIRFSLDAISHNTYKTIHGVKGAEVEKVISNIRDCVAIKKRTGINVDIGVQALLMPENIDEIEDFVRVVKDTGADNVQIKPCHDHPQSSHKPLIYQDICQNIEDKLSKYETEDFQVVVRLKSMKRVVEDRTYRECHGFHFYALVDAEGNVIPCNLYYGKPEFSYGNINEESFHSIWTGSRRREIIRKVSLCNFSQCGNYRCRLDVMNRYLERVKYPEKNDEFI